MNLKEEEPVEAELKNSSRIKSWPKKSKNWKIIKWAAYDWEAPAVDARILEGVWKSSVWVGFFRFLRNSESLVRKYTTNATQEK